MDDIPDHRPARSALIGLMTGIEDREHPAMADALDAMVGDLEDEHPWSVTLAAVEMASDLVRQVARWTGEDEAEIIRGLAAAMAERDRSQEDDPDDDC